MTAEPETPLGARPEPPLLALREVHHTYGHGARANTVLHGIDLEVHAGRSLGIVGESGAGKSTILSLLMALSSPSNGQVEFRGAPLRGSSDAPCSWSSRTPAPPSTRG